MQKASQRAGGKKPQVLGSLGSPQVLAYYFKSKRGKMNAASKAFPQPGATEHWMLPSFPRPGSTTCSSRAVPGILNHCAPDKVGLGTGHGTLQLLEFGHQSSGQSLDKTPLDFKISLILWKKGNMGHLLVLCISDSLTRLSTSDF